MAPIKTTTVAKLYITTTVIVGLAVVLQSIVSVTVARPIRLEWLILAALTVLTGSFTVKVPSMTARLTVSETFVFASVLLFGVACGTLTVVLETLVIAFWAMREKRSLHRAIFNVAASALSIWVAATAFFRMAGTGPLLDRTVLLSEILWPLIVLTVVFFFLNSSLVAIAVGIEKGQSPIQIWWNNFTWVSINYFSGASVAAVIVTYASPLSQRALFGTFIVTVPLLVVCYLTFRTAMARVEDSNLHLSKLNKLYLSTVETLAMAIDAKDQVTHGHIRRVQLQAVNLAKEIGVKDETLLKAIEAAALLHDMGKLAVPEYILNKPGKLTDAEFEKMKLHASVGADILSAIDFPYPVVPIVRHHHENWDGTGYPSGLKGTDIPIGARILSVVDCFDALTSDRPYRRRLSDVEAINILHDRRGSMYDPMIVDAFTRVHDAAPLDPKPIDATSHVLTTIAHSHTTRDAEPLPITADASCNGGDDLLSVYELASALAGHASISDAADVIHKHLARLVPSALCIFFIYDMKADELEARHVVGDSAAQFIGMRIPAGQRISGWVASNRKTVVNSDAILDLNDEGKKSSLHLRSCLSTPLSRHGELIGALSLYSTKQYGFNDDHRRIIESVAAQIGHTLYCARDLDSASSRDVLTGLPHVEQLESVINSINDTEPADIHPHLLLLIQVASLEEINATHGRAGGDAVLRHVVRQTHSALRLGDILFRSSGDEFVAFLSSAEPDTADRLASQIADQIARHYVAVSATASIKVHVSVTKVLTPIGKTPVREVISLTRQRTAPDFSREQRTVIH